MTGKDSLHGPHQEAQKSISTTLFDVAGGLPSSVNAARSGKRSPALTPAIAFESRPADKLATNAHAVAKCLGCGVSIESSSLIAGGFSSDDTLHTRTEAHQLDPIGGAQHEKGGR